MSLVRSKVSMPGSIVVPPSAGNATRRARVRPLEAAVSIAFYASVVGLVFVTGGLLHVALDRVAENAAVRRDQLIGLSLATVLLLFVVIACGRRLVLQSSRHFGMGLMTLGLLAPLTLACAEGVARLAAPTWPAIGLHGVRPDVASESWGRVQATEAVGINAWGQRDRPRTMRPSPGVSRIAFIGDSFLEEATSVPLSLLVERKLGRKDVEVINLGVSASSPDEYYHRTHSIALPLGSSHCVTFLFAGNDFVESGATLPTYAGIAATYPRDSFLESVGLLGINHLLTNRQRPVIRAWLGSGDLRRQEEYRGLVLSEAGPEIVRKLLLDAAGLPPAHSQRLQKRLDSPQFDAFLKLLKAPDGGQFRSYYLSQALIAGGDDAYRWERNSEASAFHWVEQTAQLCQGRNVKLTVVIIPEAFQVDSRMVEQWKPLADMRRVTQATREASERLKARALEKGLDVIDLHEVLQDVPGTYLNFDGHWSDKGAELVAEVLAKRLKP